MTSETLSELLAEIRACRLCEAHLPHGVRPVLHVSATAKLCIVSQAPGIRVHETGLSFNDASGDRLRDWMGIKRATFYDESKVAIAAIAFCFPGYDAKRRDLPPRRECAATWHQRLFAAMPQLDLILAVGTYAQRWHLGATTAATMSALVGTWREALASSAQPRRLALPHPSWRNNHWLTANPWFERDLLPRLREEVRRLI